MNEEKSEAIALTRQLVQIESTNPGSEEGRIADWISQWLEERDFLVEKDEIASERYNLRASKQVPDGSPALIFICHMDTVTVGEGWTREPFAAAEEQGRIYGRGACDMKSGLACALTAFARGEGEDRTKKRPLVFLATSDEEGEMRGVERVIEAGWVTKDDWILDMEPTDGQIQASHKGRFWVKLQVQGVTAHASTPWKGADAIAGISEVITHMRKAFAQYPPDPDLGQATITFGMIEGGYQPYVVPDHASVTIDMRLAPPLDRAEALAIIQRAAEAAEKQVPGIGVTWEITGNRPYIRKPEQSELLQQLATACQTATGERPTISTFPGYTDTAVIAAKTGNQNCMSYGPGSLKMAHKPDEYVEIRDIKRCEAVLEELLRQI